MSALSKYMVSAVAAQARINSCSPNIFFGGGETKAARYLSWLLVAMNRRPASLLTARIALDLIGACAPFERFVLRMCTKMKSSIARCECIYEQKRNKSQRNLVL
jgi:hypothetical protein